MRRTSFRIGILGIVYFAISLAAAPIAEAQTELAKTDANIRHATRKVASSDLSTVQNHPLWPALELAVGCYKHIRKNVRDYSCSVVRRERVNGKLQEREFIAAKVRHLDLLRVRHQPFSVYMFFLQPNRGQECLYVAGENDGDMLVRNGGKRFAFVTTKISPTSDTAMLGNRYPLTEFGMENLVRRLIEVVKEDIRINAETEVEFFNDATVDGRGCTGVRVTHPVYNSQLRFHTATVFMDNELQVPVHYEAYDWPQQEGGEPRLLEQYTYRDIKLNVGFSKRDFDSSNPNYNVK